MAETVLRVLEGYMAVGAVVALAFALLGVGRVDPGARGLSVGNVVFRLMILPGATALWPLIVARWIGAGRRRNG